MNIKGHFETITRHKLLVMKYCFACGLYEQGLAHDLSKYSPTEFIPGCIYYQGDHSPNEAEREARGYTSAWLHHKGRNKHHLEYWIDYSTTKTGLTGMKIPLRYVCEMVCDRVAASQIYLGGRYTDASPWEYYEHSKDHYLLHPETRALLVCAAAVTMLCAAAGATAAPVTAETPAQKQAVLDTINAVRQQNGLAPVAETADADAQADRMAALYFSTDDGDAYDAQWLAILDTEVEGKVSIGDCYSYKLQNGGWDITDWNNMDLLPTPAFKLLKSADVTMVGISFTNEGGVVLLPY